jgi:hypothetical protein
MARPLPKILNKFVVEIQRMRRTMWEDGVLVKWRLLVITKLPKKLYSDAILITKDSMQIALRLNPSLCSEKPATGHLNYCVAMTNVKEKVHGTLCLGFWVGPNTGLDNAE